MRLQQFSLFYLPSIHQISTFEKTEFYQRSILSSLVSVRTQRVSPFCNAAQFGGLRGDRLSCRVFPGLSDAVEGSTSRVLSQHRETKFIYRLRFCCDLFFTWIFLRSVRHHFRTIGRTEMADVKHKRWLVSPGQYVCELVSGVNVLDSIKQPNKSNSVDSGNMSHCRTSSFYDHLDHCFRCLQTHTTKLSDEKIGRLRELNKHFPNHGSFFEIACVCESCEVENKFHACSTTGLPVLYGSDSCFQELKRSDPTDQEREHHPTSILHPKNRFLILLNCVKLKFVSCTSNLLEQMHDFQKRHNVPPEVDFESSESPAKSESGQSQPALFSSITNITILFVFTCVMDVRYRTI